VLPKKKKKLYKIGEYHKHTVSQLAFFTKCQTLVELVSIALPILCMTAKSIVKSNCLHLTNNVFKIWTYVPKLLFQNTIVTVYSSTKSVGQCPFPYISTNTGTIQLLSSC
jgi:hypothetical protein